ncbi:uncharacterized protein [Halyomorpha halys]|uniref:uncharacterized protein n=1 Tax=Halyomorpha halys TaxID=286706 RepID=UPI0006D4FE61|nr:uncharacterized protein LOC106689551 [Halyomorpha halys]XP_014290056.1 uncharacterized protein LOC106689551 [Halyomorpha halys]XP_014290057.1 uncharacterized protein LOC106689551 [Halyomorpha halys]XP_014290059.1 uncharacterized protein LOC106689551 [Halyomorpha halys]XP_014290060.1 uncharacterized protein LOC106689551 [Halyomorpha halys]XP_014290061.1 uncharacterized protein LOC106689551 [Halyomorpha halys]XP_014290062.1 uncharacterized protein LOC106689551 [Halyomorpha halys]
MMDVERLIDEVRKYPVLYDQKNERYRNTEHKDKIWNEIATTLGSPGGPRSCKSKWSVIRDHLLKTLKKRQSTMWMGSKNFRKYKYEESLQFLIPHIGLRDGISNIFCPEEFEGERLDTEQSQETPEKSLVPEVSVKIEEEVNITPIDDTPLHSNHTHGHIEPGSRHFPMPKDFFMRPTLLKKKNALQRKSKGTLDSASSQLMAYMLEERKAEKRMREAENRMKKDPVDAFLEGIAPSLRTLNSIFLNQAKGQIFSIVQEYEMKQLMLNQHSSVSDIQSSNFLRTPNSPSSETSSTYVSSQRTK